VTNIKNRNFTQQTKDSRLARTSLDAGTTDHPEQYFGTNPYEQPALTAPVATDHIDRAIETWSLRSRRYFGKMKFEEKASYYIRVGKLMVSPTRSLSHLHQGLTQLQSSHSAKELRLEELTAKVLENVLLEYTENRSFAELVLMFVSKKSSTQRAHTNHANSVCHPSPVATNTIPFTQEQFVKIMDGLKLSPDLVRSLYTGKLAYGDPGHPGFAATLIRSAIHLLIAITIHTTRLL
jgi:hypothetical protein